MPSTGIKLVRDYGCGPGGYVTARQPEVIEGTACIESGANGERQMAVVHEGQILARIGQTPRYEREAGDVVLLGSADAVAATEPGHRVRVVLSARRIHNLTTNRSFIFRRP